MNSSESINELAAALAKARLTFGAITKSRTVTVVTAKGNYGFAYAPLETILEAITRPLAENGLSLLQGVRARDVRGEVLATRLIHSSGQWLENETPIVSGQGSGPQAYGSSLTYSARYGIRTLLVLSTDEDDDGNASEGNHVQAKARKPAAVAAAPARAVPAAPSPAPPDAHPNSEFARERDRFSGLLKKYGLTPTQGWVQEHVNGWLGRKVSLLNMTAEDWSAACAGLIANYGPPEDQPAPAGDGYGGYDPRTQQETAR